MPENTENAEKQEEFFETDPVAPSQEEKDLARYFEEDPEPEPEEKKTEQEAAEEKKEEEKAGEGGQEPGEPELDPGEPEPGQEGQTRRGRPSSYLRRIRTAERRVEELEKDLFAEKQFRQSAEERAERMKEAAKADPADFQAQVEEGRFEEEKKKEEEGGGEPVRARYEPTRAEQIFLEELGSDGIPEEFIRDAAKAWPEVLHTLPRLKHPDVMLAHFAEMTDTNPQRLREIRAMSAGDLRDYAVGLEQSSMARAQALNDVRRLAANQKNEIQTQASAPAARPKSSETEASTGPERGSFWI